jgi:transcriptional regulator with XRE-family HTH domain
MKQAKNKNSIRDIIGFTQKELAMLLGVTRSKLAKYELGLGDLPDPAKLLLAELLNHMNEVENASKSGLEEAIVPTITEEQLKRLILENTYQLNLVNKKVKSIQKKQADKSKAQKLLVYLNNRPQEKSQEHQDKLRLITNNTNKALKMNSHSALYEYQLKQEMLELEKTLLEAEKKKWSKALKTKGNLNNSLLRNTQ